MATTTNNQRIRGMGLVLMEHTTYNRIAIVWLDTRMLALIEYGQPYEHIFLNQRSTTAIIACAKRYQKSTASACLEREN